VDVEVLDHAAVRSLEARLAEVAGQLNAAHGRLVELVGEALDGGLWSQAGIASPEQWLAWQSGLSPARDHQIVLLARRRAELPATTAALVEGSLAVDQATVVAQRAPAWADSEACQLARFATVAQARRVLNAYVFEPPAPVTAAPPAPADPSPVDQCRFHADEAGRFHLHAEGDVDGGSVVEAALTEAHDALTRQGHRDVSWWDALVEVAERSLSAATPRSRLDRFRSYLHLEADASDPAGLRARFAGGAPLPVGVRRLLGCDSVVRPVWWEQGVPVKLGRAQRTVPAHVRRLVLHRDHHACRVPGCDATRWLDVHHIVHWEDGGTTDTDNLVTVCRAHHRAHHRGTLAISGNADGPDGITVSTAHGLLRAGGRPQPPSSPPPVPAAAYEHPPGERLQLWAIHFNRPPP